MDTHAHTHAENQSRVPVLQPCYWGAEGLVESETEEVGELTEAVKLLQHREGHILADFNLTAKKREKWKMTSKMENDFLGIACCPASKHKVILEIKWL